MPGLYSVARETLQNALDTLTDEDRGGYHGDRQHCEVLSELGDAHLRCGYVESALTFYSNLSDMAQEQQLPLLESTWLIVAPVYVELLFTICKNM